MGAFYAETHAVARRLLGSYVAIEGSVAEARDRMLRDIECFREMGEDDHADRIAAALALLERKATGTSPG
jgi:hypothetical protein